MFSRPPLLIPLPIWHQPEATTLKGRPVFNLSTPDIQAPGFKAITSIGAGAGSSMLAMSQQAASFLPKDLSGWLSVAASTAALAYSLCLLWEWWWKRVWGPMWRRWRGARR
jgi:hypothetical protein